MAVDLKVSYTLHALLGQEEIKLYVIVMNDLWWRAMSFSPWPVNLEGLRTFKFKEGRLKCCDVQKCISKKQCSIH